ncbi:MAG: fused MFS/spermidine synthase [Armatimonadetes bacterium]|nr:fused MFS/spermidine synthase [Armatimonadota bacterium]
MSGPGEACAILELIVFTSGGVLLALEIIASRVLAPHFGTSIYVWGSLIGVFLGALSLGYYLGGNLADRWPSPAVFAGIVFLAGLLIFPIPLVGPRVLDAIVLRDLGPRANPLVAATLLFFAPSVVMGMVSPFAVRLRARTVATVGNVAGVLYALSTLGSIVGTLLAAFILIELAGVRAIIHILGLTLVALAAVGWLAARRFAAATVAALLVVLLAVAVVMAGPRRDRDGLIFERDTVYHKITVVDEGRYRYMKLDNYWQSGLDQDTPLRSVFPYTEYMHAAFAFKPDARRVLVVGLGGGTLPQQFHAAYPDMQIDVVEIDPAVIETARRFFKMPRSSRVLAVAQDGRLFIRRAQTRYDVIFLDAYLIDTIPFHLATYEFFEEARARLAPGGLVVSNIIGALDGRSSRLFRAIYKTFTRVFATVYVLPVEFGRFGDAEGTRNIILVGTTVPRLDRAARQDRVAAAAARFGWEVRRREAAVDVYEGLINTRDVPVLTDDYAPVDILIARR